MRWPRVPHVAADWGGGVGAAAEVDESASR